MPVSNFDTAPLRRRAGSAKPPRVSAESSPAVTGEKPAEKPGFPRFLWALIALSACLAVIGAYAAVRRARRVELPVLGAVPAFAMTDQHGAPLSTTQLQGKPFIADFFFLSCPTSCPKLTARMKVLHDRIAQKQLAVRLVSITVDPENDTPDALAKKTQELHSDDRIWTFLTGKSDDLERVVVQGFKMQYENRRKIDPEASVFTIMHGDWFVLVDAQGRIRGYYDTDDPAKLEAVLRDAELLAKSPGA